MKEENIELVKQAIINEYGVSDERATLTAKAVLEGAGMALKALADKIVKLKEDKNE